MSAKPIELTAAEFVEFVVEGDDMPPLVPTDHYAPDGGPRIKCSGLVCYPLDSGETCEALVFDDGLILVSPAVWAALGGR